LEDAGEGKKKGKGDITRVPCHRFQDLGFPGEGDTKGANSKKKFRFMELVEYQRNREVGRKDPTKPNSGEKTHPNAQITSDEMETYLAT